MPQHTVSQGESMASIAYDYGFADWHVIYDHANNAALREKRPKPELLFPGDEVFIPDREVKEFSANTEQMHPFKLDLPDTTMLKIVVRNERDEPLASMPYTLTLDTHLVRKGTTDGNGLLQEEIPVTAKEGVLEVHGYRLPVHISHLDPIDETTGVQGRLHNLGYDAGPIDGSLSDQTMEALRAFQQDNGLTVNGQADGPTKSKLQEKYGC
jgi:N-acetylmuramoyl-L-alanine amidase